MKRELNLLLAIKEIERLNQFEKRKSILNEIGAKELLYHVLSKQHFLLDLDKYMPTMFIENPKTKSRVRTDFILIHLGRTDLIPNIIPVEIDWRKEELKRHLPKISSCLPQFLDLFPYRIFENEEISIEYAVKVVKESHNPYYHGGFLSPIVIDTIDVGNELAINIEVPIYSIRYYINDSMNRSFTYNMFTILTYAIYFDKVCEKIIREIRPILYFVGLKTGIIQILQDKCKLSKRLDFVNVVLNDSKGKLKRAILSATYKDLKDVLLTIF